MMHTCVANFTCVKPNSSAQKTIPVHKKKLYIHISQMQNTIQRYTTVHKSFKCLKLTSLSSHSCVNQLGFICVYFEIPLPPHLDHSYSLANQIEAYQSTNHYHVRACLPGCYVISCRPEFKSCREVCTV